MLFIFALLSLTLASNAAQKRILHIDEALGSVNAYMDTHGVELLQTFARSRLADAHPGGPDAVRDETVNETAKRMLDKLATQSVVEKRRYLAGVHDRLARLSLIAPHRQK